MDKVRFLTCKSVWYYSQKDEDAFFEWIEKIECIESFEGVRDELYLNLIDCELEYEDMQDLIALFYRYKVNMRQLAPFVNKKNRDAAIPWKKHILFDESAL
jgi:hypothetical protein